MDKQQRTTSPQALFQSREQEYLLRAAEFLEHEGLLEKQNRQWVFLHQTFFDYAYARFFVERGESLSERIFNSPQGLVERPLIIHVLGYLRTTDQSIYNLELNNLGITNFFEHPDLRKHLRRLLREWFGALSSPSDLEWRLARRILSKPSSRNPFLSEASRNRGWFTRLLTEYIPRWLEQIDRASPDNQDMAGLANRVFWMFDMLCDEEETQAQILRLLLRYRGGNEQWDKRLQSWVFYIKKWHTSEIVELYGQLLLQFWDGDDLYHYHFREVAKQRPLDACRVLTEVLNLTLGRIQQAPPPTLKYRMFSEVFSLLDTPSGGLKLDHEVLDELATQVPDEFLKSSWNFFLGILALNDNVPLHREDSFFQRDAFEGFWEMRTTRGVLYRGEFGRAFARALSEAITKLATEQPEIFEQWLVQLEELTPETPQMLVSDAFRTSPERYARQALEWLLSDERRLELGEQAFESRRLIRACVPYWTSDDVARLEFQILNHVVFNNEEWPERFGHEQWRLLQTLARDRLSEAGIERLEKWSAKFGEEKLPEVPILGESGFVQSPIEQTEAVELSDNQWLDAMRQYHGQTTHQEFLRGGAEQLCRVLEELVVTQPERFTRLFLDHVPLDVDTFYVKGVIRGLAKSVAPKECLFSVVRRFIDFKGPDLYGDLPKTIAGALADRAKEGLPNDLLNLMEDWVRSTPPGNENEEFYSHQENEA